MFVYQSCIVSGPKFANVDKVMELKKGMSYDQVNTHLGISPYDMNKFDSIGRRSFVYKYRVMDRKTVPLLLKETNGVKSKGKYMDLIAFYDSSNIVYNLESRYTDSKLREKRLNFNSVMTVITVTAPSVLLYLGIKKE